ncbi:nitroreductase family deazaflavin-dependent oxidoreductase [Hamadaea tsunoensis]|uniref:nitroreductase family deazaflavin-dependent oxidoreductase n=1 Tax=Hamadaea tsunoensis TaxID=53368 RepID=UPI000406E2B4|nr:nitroreductase family deazaflavin-dependent oxidoreductase [Hamadaea tsunoensis]
MPQTLIQRLGSRRWFARMGRALVPADRFIAKITKGRVVALGLLPMLTITTTGRKSGQPRVQPLVYVPDGEGFAVIGSNWGQAGHPAWSGNLLAHPDAVIRVKGHDIPVRATLAKGAERERLWKLLLGAWPAYEAYAARAPHRELRIFSLTRKA